jgi:ABC-2 type transport system ATP-binding protein
MRLEELERYVAPLYATWDPVLANRLRERFDLDSRRTIQSLSRGQRMKAALLCVLAARPRLLLMDEPFTGMDALVKDELVSGLLESAGAEGWTILLCSHDIGELELLADWVGFLDRGRLEFSEPMDALRARFKKVDVTMPDESGLARGSRASADWLLLERSGDRVSGVLATRDGEPADGIARAAFPTAVNVDVRSATLREVFVAMARRSHSQCDREDAA